MSGSPVSASRVLCDALGCAATYIRLACTARNATSTIYLLFSCDWTIPQLPFRHSENLILTQRSVLAVSSQIFLPKKWSEHHRRDDGEQQPISPVEREFGAESHGKRHGLEVIRALMNTWGHPQ